MLNHKTTRLAGAMAKRATQISNFILLGSGYLTVVVGLFLYSFTQVDLSLTLSEWSVWQVIQKFFQHIGYFQRPLSTFLYIAIVLLLYLFYFLFLRLSRIGGIRDIGGIWGLVIATTIILTFSYNAFSYDLFNYMFDAKIVTYYHQNPYEHKALEYLGDPMLSFMHGVHRTYPYGLVWLILTVPLSLGINFFLPTFFLFKLLASLSFLGTVFFIGKILNKFSPQNEVFAIVFFALNPLVLIESLVSAHNDIVMMFFAVWALYLLLSKKYTRSIILLVLSIGVKFATVLLVPVFLYIAIKQLRKQSIDFKKVFMIIFVLMTIAVVITSFASGINKNPEIQPWYFLMLFPFANFVAQKRIIVFLTISMSFAMLASYIPYILTGEWPKDIVGLKNMLLTTSIIGAVFLSIVLHKRFIHR